MFFVFIRGFGITFVMSLLFCTVNVYFLLQFFYAIDIVFYFVIVCVSENCYTNTYACIASDCISIYDKHH